MLKRLKGYRTGLFNLFVAVIIVLHETNLLPLLPPNWGPWAMVIVSIVNLWLRSITDGPPAWLMKGWGKREE